MKKIITLLLAFMLIFSLIACREEVQVPEPTPEPTVLYIKDNRGVVPDMENYITAPTVWECEKFKEYILEDDSYADYNFSFYIRLYGSRLVASKKAKQEEVDRLIGLGYNVWLDEEGVVRGIASHEQLKNFPYVERFGYDIGLSKK
ncbi:MAG: hypothetical protein E7332_04835 [Clostridiales bacterium]|nr:hypothetical protein [Clostridiales bacterium]